MSKKNMREVLVISGPRRSDWKVQTIDANDLATLQGLVGGYIEGVDLPHGLRSYVNEEGLIMRLPPTVRVMAGPLAGTTLHGPVVVLGRFRPSELHKVENVLQPVRNMLTDGPSPDPEAARFRALDQGLPDPKSTR